MNRELDTNRLFLSQVSAHVAELTALLGLGPQDRIDDLVDRGLLSTSMLATSASLMELAEWEAFLGEFERLLRCYKEKHLPWDERIAQLCSELIEREEAIVADWTDETVDIRKLFVPEHWEALNHELDALVDISEAMPARPDNWDEMAQAEPEVTETTPAVSVSPDEEPVADDRSLGRGMMALKERTDALLADWARAGWSLDDAPPTDVDSMRRNLHLIDFYARTTERTLNTKVSAHRTRVLSTLEPIHAAIVDYANALCSGTNRCIDLILLDDENTTDVRLLLPVQRVVQLMIGDIFLRCDDEYIRVEVHVDEREGSLLWSVRDNGSNFMADSPIDPGEYLAFYPGLREASHVLQRLRGLLWVEPNEDQETRFAFTVPDSPEGDTFKVWGDENDQFAVPASQISAVLAAESVAVQKDARGEHVTYQGQRAPLIRLGEVYAGAPADGSCIAVVGCLEKRIAFYVDGMGRVESGDWLRNAVPLWPGMNPGTAEIDAVKMPLVEANGLIEHFLRMNNDAHNEGLPGGVAGNENDLSQRQAQTVKDTATPPDSVSPAPPPPQVLIVERSAVLRDELQIILDTHGVDSEIVEDLDNAIDWLSRSTPALIVSEFRMPSMAAKVLAEQLSSDGREVPILVMTSREANDADLLVSKLGVEGYIRKPLEAAEVWSLIDAQLSAAVELSTP